MWPAFPSLPCYQMCMNFSLQLNWGQERWGKVLRKINVRGLYKLSLCYNFPFLDYCCKILQIKLRSPLIMCRSVCNMVKVNTPFPLQMRLAGSLARTRPHFPFLRQCQIPFWFLGHSRKDLPELPLMVQLVAGGAIVGPTVMWELIKNATRLYLDCIHS